MCVPSAGGRSREIIVVQKVAFRGRYCPHCRYRKKNISTKTNMGSACSRYALYPEPFEPVTPRDVKHLKVDTTTNHSVEDTIEVTRERRSKSKSLQILGVE